MEFVQPHANRTDHEDLFDRFSVELSNKEMLNKRCLSEGINLAAIKGSGAEERHSFTCLVLMGDSTLEISIRKAPTIPFHKLQSVAALRALQWFSSVSLGTANSDLQIVAYRAELSANIFFLISSTVENDNMSVALKSCFFSSALLPINQ